MDEVVQAVVGPEEDGTRLDVLLTARGFAPSRSAAKQMVASGCVIVDGATEHKSGRRLRAGARVRARLLQRVEEPEDQPEPIPLDVRYEDEHVIVVNKARGMVVHPAPGHPSGTLVNALLAHCPDLRGIGGVRRPGIVHRLDKETSGLIVAAKTQRAHRSLTQQLKERRVDRRYVAIVHGNIKDDAATIDAPIGRHPVHRQKMAVGVPRGRPAVTHFRVLERFGAYTLIEARLETGRTHQIRVHMAHIGHPLMGDTRYGPRKPRFLKDGQALHAGFLGFDHPFSGVRVECRAAMPQVLEHVLERLRGMAAGRAAHSSC